jgi:hypothetical protein
MKHLLPLLGLGLLAACGSGAVQPVDDVASADSSATVAAAPIDLASQGLPLLLTPPDKQLTAGQDPAMVWKDETGTLEIRAGDHFGLMIREEPGDIPRLKASLERDLLKKNTLLRETPELLTYKSEFPDDPSLVFMHFCQVVRAGDRTFVVQDIDGQTFNQQDIERMMAAVSPKPPA